MPHPEGWLRPLEWAGLPTMRSPPPPTWLPFLSSHLSQLQFDFAQRDHLTGAHLLAVSGEAIPFVLYHFSACHPVSLEQAGRERLMLQEASRHCASPLAEAASLEHIPAGENQVQGSGGSSRWTREALSHDSHAPEPTSTHLPVERVNKCLLGE